MWKTESNNQYIQNEADLIRVASYAERKDFIRSRFDKNYTGTTRENEVLLRNEKFKKAYLEQFAHIKNTSRNARMDLIANRPDQNPEIQKVREWFFANMSRGLSNVFRGVDQSVASVDKRIVAWGQALRAYSGKIVRQFSSVKLTGYFPPPKWGYRSKKEAKMEWGGNDKIWKPLYTLQQYLRWEAPYVSIAGHKSIAYWTRVRLPNLEAQYGRPIECRVVDTGKAFNKQPPFAKLDICVQDRQSSLTNIVNTNTSVQQIA